MRCGNCGSEIKDGSAFCPRCGARQEQQSEKQQSEKCPQKTNAQQVIQPAGKNTLAGSHGWSAKAIIGIAAAGVTIVAIIVAAAIFRLRSNDQRAQEPVMVDSGADNVGGEESATGESQNEIAPEQPLYYIQDVASIDLQAQNYAAGAKQPGMIWDRSLFYWLEDVNTNSTDDGYIANCMVTKTLLRDVQSQKLRQYEIYRDPGSGAIYKIVSIEETDGGMSLVDYYYKNGQPNFIFQRADTVYTPTYATIQKVGERYYFDSEVMVRWRMIRVPGEIGEYTLTPDGAWYSQGDYYAESDELRSIYDDVELRMLNAAHNTYDAIAAGGNIGMVQGYLRDTVGNGIAGKKVKVYRVSDNALLYETTTDDSGLYTFYIYLDDTAGYIKVEADDQYKEMTVQGIQFRQSAVTYTYNLTMHKNSGDEYPVTFHVYSGVDVVSDENGTATGGALREVTAIVREGAGNYNGNPLCTVETQNGELVTNLPNGVYTVQFHTEGYLDTYMEVEVMEEAAVRDAYVMTSLAETQTGVVLTWDSDEVDLDLTLFTPYQAANGDMAHIGGNVDQDGHGNFLVSDNKRRCEVMYINSGEPGSYKLYVNDYTDSVAGCYASDVLYRINVHIYIYNSNGFVAEYTVPLGQTGVVWEVVEINGSNVTPAQRMYSEISGKNWWIENKEVWSAEEDARLLEVLNGERSNLRELMEALVHNLDEKGINTMLRGEKEGIESLFDLLHKGGEPTALDLSYVIENQPQNADELLEQGKGVWMASEHAEYLNDVIHCFLTEEQAEYLIYSICGKRIDFDFSTYDTWIAPYIGFGQLNEYQSWDHLEHFSVERIDANTWNVRANNFHYEDCEFPCIASRVCFTVVKNPDSCFEGYSLTNFIVEEEVADISWAMKYYDFLTTDPDGVSIAESCVDYRNMWQGIRFYNLIYVDDDLIPEIYINEESFSDRGFLLFCTDGGVDWMMFDQEDAYYVPYTGLLRRDGVRGTGPWIYNYKLEDGRIMEIGSYNGEGHMEEVNGSEFLELVIGEEEYTLDGNEVTKEQYEEFMNSYSGEVELQSLESHREPQYFDLLEVLEDLLWFYLNF